MCELDENIKRSNLYKDYEEFKYIPSVDALLDYRSALMDKLKQDSGIENFLKNEIKATDYLLNLKQNEQKRT